MSQSLEQGSETQSSVRRFRPTASIRNGSRSWPSTQPETPSSPMASSYLSSSPIPESQSDSQESQLVDPLYTWHSDPDPRSIVKSLTSTDSDDFSTPSKKNKHKPKPRSSWVFKHMPDEDPMTKYWPRRDTTFLDQNIVWKCKYCLETAGKEFKLSGGTRCASQHLIRDHGIEEG